MRIFISAIALVLLISSSARSAILDIEVTPPGSVNHSFSSFYGLNNYLEMDAGPLTANIAEYDSIRFQMQMNEGQAIIVDTPAGETVTFTIAINLTVPLSTLDSSLYPPTTIDFLEVSGAAPTLIEGGLRIRENGNQMDLRAQYESSAPFSFNGFRSTSIGPFNDNGEKTLINQYGARFNFRYSTSNDAGPYVSIVPEPSSLALLGLGGLLVSLRRAQET